MHLSPDGHELRVRFRIDGVLLDSATVPRRMVSGVISRVKIMSDLDIAERRVPQDGRVGLTIDGHHVDLRVVSLPSVHGESIVMRILDTVRGRAASSASSAWPTASASASRRPSARPTAPSSSPARPARASRRRCTRRWARSTRPRRTSSPSRTRSSARSTASRRSRSTPRAGLTFASGLRAMMRADPDIIMVGEIRDRETAQIAIEGALTGHLVLSTLHTNDAPGAISRLIEMGIEPFLVASALDCIVAQRLARTLCQHCKRRTILSAEVMRDHGFPALADVEAYEPVGCARCGGSGYRGRIGLYEVMTVTEEIRTLAIERASADRIAEVAVRQGMRRLQRGRPREGQAGPDLDRRGLPRDLVGLR